MDILNGQFIDFMMTQLQIDLLPQTINAKMRIAGFVLKGEEMREYLGFDNQEATDWEGRNRVLKKISVSSRAGEDSIVNLMIEDCQN